MAKAGFINGKHYTFYVDTVKQLKRDGKLDEAEKLLLKLIDAVEEESRQEGVLVAPWYYEQLAILYRKQKLYEKEVSILTRFVAQRHEKGHPLEERLTKARLATAKVEMEK